MAITEMVAPAATPTQLKMSYEDFLEWDNEDTLAEWVPTNNVEDGEVIIFMPTKKIHQVTLQFLFRLLELFINLFNSGKIQIAPFEMKAKPDGSSREPDLLFVATKNLERLTEDRLLGPADLIIEIISKDSVSRDRNEKFQEYAAAAVPEYWIIDPRPNYQLADFFALDEAGIYRRFATETDKRVESRVLSGFWLNPAWLWQADERDPFLTFCEMAGLSKTLVNQFREHIQAGFKQGK